MTSNFEPRTIDLELLSTYLYMFLAYYPLLLLTKTLTLAWLGILACIPRMISSFACCFSLHVLLFLPVVLLQNWALPYQHLVFPQNSLAPNKPPMLTCVSSQTTYLVHRPSIVVSKIEVVCSHHSSGIFIFHEIFLS